MSHGDLSPFPVIAPERRILRGFIGRDSCFSNVRLPLATSSPPLVSRQETFYYRAVIVTGVISRE